MAPSVKGAQKFYPCHIFINITYIVFGFNYRTINFKLFIILEKGDIFKQFIKLNYSRIIEIAILLLNLPQNHIKC